MNNTAQKISHTPGPWEVYLTDHNGAHIGTVAESPGHITTVAEGTASEISANARLIAAAPALAGELRNMLAPFERFTDAQVDVVIAKNGGMSYGRFGLDDAKRVKSARAALAAAVQS
jgi:hypothetical protein